VHVTFVSKACALVVTLFLQLPGLASAQGSHADSYETGAVVYAGADAYRVVQRWRGTRGQLEIRGRDLTRSIDVVAPGPMSCAANTEGLRCAILSGEPAVRTIFVPFHEQSEQTWTSIERPGGPELAPIGVSVFARPDGFGIWWQEASTANVNDLWRTFEARVDVQGTVAPARELGGMRWPLMDAAYVEAGSTFALLLYGTGDPQASRLCAVRISDAGEALEHPWWASRAGLITEAQLVVNGARAFAVYRGGRGGNQLLEGEVTTGQWAQERPEPRSHGTIDSGEIYGARPDGSRIRVEQASMR
jgi:hypothetical protein